jgi:GR25 family glycosyltransferase involved in LPS biosynthesis
MQEVVLEQMPVFVINLKKRPDRWEYASQEIAKAGFKDIRRFEAVDGKDAGSLRDAWAVHGNPRFNPRDGGFKRVVGKQGCCVSHLNLWKHIIDKHLVDGAVVFEDDVCFHPKWDSLSREYYDLTPKDYGMIFMGCQFLNSPKAILRRPIVSVPIYCTHAYIITYEGAKTLHNHILNHRDGVYTIDCMFKDFMSRKQFPCPFYCWNGTLHPTNAATHMKHGWVRRNGGLVFQKDVLGSDIG